MSLKEKSAKKLAEHIKNLNSSSHQINNLKFLPEELRRYVNQYLIKPKIISFAISKYLIHNKKYDFKKTFLNIDEAYLFVLSPNNRKLAVKTSRGFEVYNLQDKEFDFLFEKRLDCKKICFCPDNSCILIIDHFGNIKLYDCIEGLELAETSTQNIIDAQFNSDGSFLAVAFDNNEINIYLTDLCKQKKFGSIEPIRKISLKNTKRLPKIIWSSDSKLCAAVFKKNVELYDLNSGNLIFEKQFYGRENEITVAISPDSKYIAIADNSNFKSYLYKIPNKILDVHNLEKVESNIVLNGYHFNKILSLEFSASGTEILETSHDGSVCIYKLNKFDEQILLEPKIIIKNLPNFILSGRFSPDGALVAVACYDGFIYIFNADLGELLTKLEGYKRFEHNFLKFSTTGYLPTFIGENRDQINVYDLSFIEMKEKLYNLNLLEVLLLIKCYKAARIGKRLNLCSCQDNYFAKYYNENKEKFNTFLLELIEPSVLNSCSDCSK